MPRPRKNAKTKRVSKRTARRGKLAIPRGMRPSEHMFTRSFVESVNLTDSSTWPSYWGVPDTSEPGIAGIGTFKLTDLADHTDFTSLFTQYKINAVQQKIYCSATNADVTAAGNRQVMMYYKPNHTGATPTLTEDYFLTSQTAKCKTLVVGNGRPTTFYTPLKQHMALYGGIVSTDYAPIRPKFISTTEDGTPHYGNVFRFQPIYTDNVFPSVYLKIVTKFYITCKEVQ